MCKILLIKITSITWFQGYKYNVEYELKSQTLIKSDIKNQKRSIR